MTLVLLSYALATFLSTLLGGAVALRFSSWMDRIMAFSGGVLLAAGMLDLLPESISLASSPGRSPAAAVHQSVIAAVAGFVLFYLVERWAILRSYHTHHHHPEDLPAASVSCSHVSSDSARRQVGILGAAGLCIHSMLDGVAVGVAFRANPALGAVVAAAIIAHDFSDGVTTVALLLSQKNSRRTSIYWLAVDALAPLLGIGLTCLIHLSTGRLSLLLGGFAGMFLYLGATHLLPEAHAMSDSWVTVVGMLVGVGVMALVTLWI